MKSFIRTFLKIVPLLSLMVLAQITLVMAQSTITIDGSFADWAGIATWVDTGGVDDEASPARADVTEFRSDSDSNGLYVLMAWDDTAFTGGQATTAGLTFRSASNAYFRIYGTAEGNPGSIPLANLQINSCTDSTCSSQSTICIGAACTGALVGSGVTWADPFTRPTPACNGTSCGTRDTAVEIFVPWGLIGGAPGDGQFVFLQFGSYPSGPAQAPKDDTGSDGIACLNTGGVFQCFPSTPTAITLKSFRASSQPVKMVNRIGIVLTTILLITAFGIRIWSLTQTRRQTQKSP